MQHVQKLPQWLEETHAINGRGNHTQINTPNTDNMRFELQTKHITEVEKGSKTKCDNHESLINKSIILVYVRQKPQESKITTGISSPTQI